MDVMLPPWASGMLNMAGVPWPNISESKIRHEADSWRRLTGQSAASSEGADQVVRTTGADYKGASATALAGHWEKTGGTGHLGLATRASSYAPVLLDGTATVVTGTKIAVISQAAAATVKLATSMLAGGPLALGTATATVLAARAAMGRILREAGEGGARVLAPGLARKVTEPLERILRNARGPFGGPPLAMAGGPRHIPGGVPRFRPPKVDGPGKPSIMQMSARRRQNSANKTNSGVRKAGSRGDAESQARTAAADGGSRAVFRGPCKSDDHFHVDYLNNRGEIMHTRHFPFQE
ncbi:WXG100-like domain-containing protein [Sphaerisporangium rhizosphaerae]|uniref:Outer membrane channel protein CpnT-like N-terminal domain-containing protein n=1 Tax=Sphaerisporangium rhizosphaerae TaxID=2269375 RepID=A0ABW2PCR6_9ACTN